jgi:hypothetical protein
MALARGRVRAWFADPSPLGRWTIGRGDFALFALLFLTLFQAGPLLAGHLIGLDLLHLDGRGQLVLSFASQGFGLAAWLLFRIHPAGRPPAETPWPATRLLEAPVAFLLLLPPLQGLFHLWQWGLESLGIDAPLQEIVRLVQHIQTPTHMALWIVLTVGLAPVMEELVFRAALFRFLSARLSLVPAALVSGACFGMAHGNLASFVPLAFLGTVLSLVYHRTGRILAAILLHALFNAWSMAVILVSAQS